MMEWNGILPMADINRNGNRFFLKFLPQLYRKKGNVCGFQAKSNSLYIQSFRQVSHLGELSVATTTLSSCHNPKHALLLSAKLLTTDMFDPITSKGGHRQSGQFYATLNTIIQCSNLKTFRPETYFL